MAKTLKLVDNGEQLDSDLEELSKIIDDTQTGWSRVALTDVDVDGRYWVLNRMTEAGLDARIDEAGNVIGRLPGFDSRAGTIMTGSHTDTVPGGGRYDGNVGVVAALEVVRSLRAEGIKLAHDLIVVDFFSEEPNRFGLSCVGSRALTGRLSKAHLMLEDSDGIAFGDALKAARVDASTITQARMNFSKVVAFVELHIEQGPRLEEQGNSIGLVTSITGISRFRGLFRGRQDHAGTTPMDRRRDAGCAAAGTVLAVESIASDHETSRGTTGNIIFTPEAINVVTQTAELFGEFRSPDSDWLKHAQEQLLAAANEHGKSREVAVEIEWLSGERPVAMSDQLNGIASNVISDLGLSHTKLYSGAEHDAALIGREAPSIMLFVPSRDGRSHCPEEFTPTSDILNGAEALLNTILRISTSETMS